MGSRPSSRATDAAFLLPILSGLLAQASFPPLSFGLAAWVALTPLAFFLARCRRARSAFLGGLLHGLAQFFPLLIWIPPVLARFGGVSVPAAWLLYALMIVYLACYPGAAAALTVAAARGGARLWLFTLPFAWVALELVRNYALFGGFPWLQLGYSQTELLALAQTADLTGVYGVSFLVVWMNAALVFALVERRAGARSLLPLAGGVAAVALCAAYGTAALRKWDRVEPSMTAALLQGNIALDDTDPLSAWKFGQGYLEMAEALGGRRAELAVLPESPVSASFERDPEYGSIVRRLAARFPLGVIFNNTGAGEPGPEERWFNSAYFVSNRGETVGRYDKVHLVPFGEYVPLRRVFFFAESITRDIGDFTPGTSVRPVAVDGHRVGAIICFEAVFPELSRALVKGGAELLVNLTNDGWYGRSAAPYQHLAMARWRAIENRRYLLRAANSGISAVVAPSGRIVRRSGLFTRETLVGDFAFVRDLTFYTRRGDLFALACVIISAGIGAGAVLARPGSRSKPEGGNGSARRTA
jgi:apolipoprotein N-acyltransferase